MRGRVSDSLQSVHPTPARAGPHPPSLPPGAHGCSLCVCTRSIPLDECQTWFPSPNSGGNTQGNNGYVRFPRCTWEITWTQRRRLCSAMQIYFVFSAGSRSENPTVTGNQYTISNFSPRCEWPDTRSAHLHNYHDARKPLLLITIPHFILLTSVSNLFSPLLWTKSSHTVI